jgi:predicted XRE-type DNA-binding protein
MSKNVFLDLGFNEEEAAGLKLRSYLFMALQEVIRAKVSHGRNASERAAIKRQIAERIDADQPKVSKILNGNFSEFSIERITEYLQRLGYDIHVGAKPCPPERTVGTVVMDKDRELAPL